MKFLKNPLFFLTLCIAMSFTGSMYKVMIPATIYNELQAAMGFSAAEMASLGSIYMFTMAISQLIVGIYINKIGSTYAITIGGCCVILGGLLFPMSSHLLVMQLSRVLSSLGTGMLFLAITKIITDLFPRQFTYLLSIYLIATYFGAPVATFLIPILTHHLGWRTALLIPTAIYITIFVICMILRPALTPPNAQAASNVSIGRSLHQILGSFSILKIFFSTSLLFGCYYALLTLMGAKALTDTQIMSKSTARLFMTLLAILPMFHNIFTSKLDKLLQKNYRYGLQGYTLLTILGSLLGILGLTFTSLHLLVPIAFLLITLPAGGFAIYCNMCRQLLPADCVALGIALLNCAAFVMISAVGWLAGRIMLHFELIANKTAQAVIYPTVTYQIILTSFGLLALLGLLSTKGLFAKQVS